MALSIKKRGLFVALVVSAIVLVLCSGTWAQTVPFGERLSSTTSNSYLLVFTLSPDAIAAAENYLNNLPLDPQILQSWAISPIAGLGLSDRYNFRDNNGMVVGNGQSLFAHLFLFVLGADPGLTVLSVERFNSNQDIIDYAQSQGIVEGGTASEIKFKHDVEKEEGDGKVFTQFKVSDPNGTINFQTKWTEPDPSHFPPTPLAPEDLVALVPFRFLRFAHAPERVFWYARQDTIYEPPISDVSLNIDINLPGQLGAIFNGLNKEDVTQFRFRPNIQVIWEITSPTP